jgi:hypothetical protein
VSARCPEGHLSHDPDYCDQCGVRIMVGQESYRYRPDSHRPDPADDWAAPGDGQSTDDPYGSGTADSRDGYGRRGAAEPAGAGRGGYDPLGIRRAPDAAGEVADPPRGGHGDPRQRHGADPYGYGRESYGRVGDAEAGRTSRPYPADPYDRDGYARGRDETDRPTPGHARNPYARDPYARDPYARGRDDTDRPAPAPAHVHDGYARGREDVDRGPYPRGARDQGGYGYDAEPLGAVTPPGAAGTATPPGIDRTDRGGAGRYLPCPNCRALYEAGARFCGTCGLDFTTGHVPTGAAAVPVTPPATGPTRPAGGYADPAVAPPAAAGWEGARRHTDPRAAGYPDATAVHGQDWAVPGIDAWEAVVEAERDYYDSGDDHRVPFPAFYPRRVFPLGGPRLLIGRRSESRGIHPEIDLSGAPEDPGISRAHAILERLPDGGYAVLDPGSTNGTRINDEPDPIEPGRPVPLQDGDRVYVGAWTRVTVRLSPQFAEHDR